MNKPVYLGLTILELSNYIVYMKKENIYVDIAEDGETRFDT